MAEYIERETLLERAEYDNSYRLIIPAEAIKAAPAADVAPVVRCRDCAHRTEMGNCGHPRYHGILPSAYPYDFCSYGVRMDGGADNETD